MADLASFPGPFTASTLAMGVLIYLARICDVSLGTVRTLMVVNGSRRIAFVLGFFEVLIWVLAASKFCASSTSRSTPSCSPSGRPRAASWG